MTRSEHTRAARVIVSLGLIGALSLLASCGGMAPKEDAAPQDYKKETVAEKQRESRVRTELKAKDDAEEESPAEHPVEPQRDPERPPPRPDAGPTPSAVDRPMSPQDPPDDPGPSTDGPSFFEGDDIGDGPRATVEGLVLDIEKQIGQYREEFGVEDFSASTPGSCDEVCDLSEAICESSERICDISADNPGESYFSEKCAWASKECKRSNQQCATCAR